MSDTGKTDIRHCEACGQLRFPNDHWQRKLAVAIAQRDKARSEADAMDEFIGAAAKREKEASAIIKSLTADINITVPIRDYAEMSPKDCYELGMMDGVAALKSQINAAIDAAIDAAMKEGEK